jgi:hypothetical protein
VRVPVRDFAWWFEFVCVCALVRVRGALTRGCDTACEFQLVEVAERSYRVREQTAR